MITFPIVIAMPMSPAPKNKKDRLPRGRIINPAINISMDNSKIFSIPSFFEKRGKKVDRKAKASNGIVVKSPADVLLKSKSLVISPKTGPTAVKGARKLNAKNTTPKIIKVNFKFDFGFKIIAEVLSFGFSDISYD